MSQITIYLPPTVEKKVRAQARRAKQSLSAYIARQLSEPRDEGGWPKGYVAMVRSWQEDPLELKEPADEVADFSMIAMAFK